MDLEETKTKLQKYLGGGVKHLLVCDGKIVVKHTGIPPTAMARIRQDAGEHDVRFESLPDKRY